MLELQRRFLVAGVIPFMCIFSQTLLQYNIIFALGGMVNHTLADWEEWPLVHPKNITEVPGTCIDEEALLQGHIVIIKDGPFPWDAKIEGLINGIISVGMMVGTLMTLFVYDYLNGRLIFAVALGFAGFLNVLAPVFAVHGGYFSTAIFRFFTGLYNAILTPVIPSLVTSWFLPSELYKMNVIVFLGIDTGRMFFSLTGVIIENIGWELFAF